MALFHSLSTITAPSLILTSSVSSYGLLLSLWKQSLIFNSRHTEHSFMLFNTCKWMSITIFYHHLHPTHKNQLLDFNSTCPSNTTYHFLQDKHLTILNLNDLFYCKVIHSSGRETKSFFQYHINLLIKGMRT